MCNLTSPKYCKFTCGDGFCSVNISDWLDVLLSLLHGCVML